MYDWASSVRISCVWGVDEYILQDAIEDQKAISSYRRVPPRVQASGANLKCPGSPISDPEA